MNRFKHLLVDTKKMLPHPWYNYHVTSDFERIIVFKHKTISLCNAEMLVAMQDGVWCAGYSFDGGSCYPGRKWGQFNSRLDAILYLLGDFEAKLNDKSRHHCSWWSKPDRVTIANTVKKLIRKYLNESDKFELFTKHYIPQQPGNQLQLF